MERQYLYSSDILLPQNCDYKKWSVIACDQYISDPNYWEQVSQIVGDSPSALNMILPEIYLESPEVDERISKIRVYMQLYLSNVLREEKNALIYTERRLSSGAVRHSIIGAVDLMDYDFRRGSAAPIRATEGTVLSRIPPRVKIREGAPLELPHVILLMDDKAETVIEPLTAEMDWKQPLYDFELMMNGGHLRGIRLTEEQQQRVINAVTVLAEPEAFYTKYGDENPLVFAVGDGNHSLATAKTAFEQLRQTLTDEEAMKHPARYALVEVMNLHDASLCFEPIYRAVFRVDTEDLIQSFCRYYPDAIRISGPAGDSEKGKGHVFAYLAGGREETVIVRNPSAQLPVGTLQNFLDDYLKTHKEAFVDYIHGVETTKKLARQSNTAGFLFRGMEKDDLFRTVIKDGALPRKTFSMGEADDKRFYLECRKIR